MRCVCGNSTDRFFPRLGLWLCKDCADEDEGSLTPEQLTSFVANAIYAKVVDEAAILALPPELQRYVSREGNFTRLPLGARYLVRDELLDYRMKDFPADLSFQGQLYDFQEEALHRLLESERGYLVAPTGAGKTVILLAAIAELGQRTLFLTHTTQIADQTAAKVKKLLGTQPNCFYGRVWKQGDFDVTIMTVQTAARQKMLPIHSCLIIDEAHHIPARTFARVLEKSPAYWKYAATATLIRKDAPDSIFPFLLSNHIVNISIADAQEILAKPQIIRIRTGLDPAQAFCLSKCPKHYTPETCPVSVCEFRESRLAQFIYSWANSDERNELVAENVIAHHRFATLVLTRTKAHARALAQKLAEISTASVVVLTGDIPRSRRKAAIEFFNENGGIIVGTESLLGEGTDLPVVDLLVLTVPSAGRGRGEQRVGRIMRKKGKRFAPIVLDFVDEDAYSMKLWFARQKVYRAKGFEVVKL